MAVKNSVKAIPLTSVDTATLITDNYYAINPNGLPKPCFYLKIYNPSNIDVYVSYDGVNNHDIIKTLESIEINIQQNAQPNTDIANMPAKTVVYIARVNGAAGVGLVYLSGYYQPQG